MRAGKGQRMPNDQIHEIFNGMISSQVKKKSYEGIHKAGCALGLTIKCKKTLMRNAKGTAHFILTANNYGNAKTQINWHVGS